MIFDDSLNENKELLKKYAGVSDGIKNEIKAINHGKENDYEKDYTKIKFNSDDDLPLNKPLKFHEMTTIIRSLTVNFIHKFFRQCSVWIVKMLQYKRIDVSEGIDVNKTSASKECELCHYWYFDNVGFRFEPHVCNKCHDVLMTAYELKKHCNIECKRSRFYVYFMGY